MEIYDKYVSKMCVCCFSKNNNEILMWSHYANNHQGVCLEFTIPDEILTKGILIEMSYNNDLNIIDQIEAINPNLIKLDINTTGKFLKCKFENWKYEEEFRAYIIPAEGNIIGKEVNFLGELTSIYFGKNTKDDDIDIVKFNTSHYPNLKYFKMGLNEGNMKMKAVLEL